MKTNALITVTVAERLLLGILGPSVRTTKSFSHGLLTSTDHGWDCGCCAKASTEDSAAWTLCSRHELVLLGESDAQRLSETRTPSETQKPSDTQVPSDARGRFSAVFRRLSVRPWCAPLIGFGVAVGLKVAYDAKALVKRAEAAEDAALVDPLTGLYNRRGWNRRVHEERKRMKRDSKTAVSVAVYMLDVDGLKSTNDERGHAAGDAVLRQVAKVIVDVTREHDVTARLGGDEFAIMTMQSQASEAALIRARLERGFHSVGLAVSIGFAFADSLDGISAAMERADGLMYEAKKNGPARVARNQ